CVLLLFVLSIERIVSGEIADAFLLAVVGGTAGFVATTLGAMPALFLRTIPQKVEDSMLGMAAGMMLAASVFSLILPGLAAGEQILGHGVMAVGVVVFGMSLGVLLMLGLDQFTPHEHPETG